MLNNSLRKQYIIKGFVQGVGFRPFVYRLANSHHITGTVMNAGSCVVIEAQGTQTNLTQFELDIFCKLPRPAHIETFEAKKLTCKLEDKFRIIESTLDQEFIHIPRDHAPCQDCLTEMLDPKNRRYAYPFTHCSSCGPRWSILESLPFDRENTSMIDFPMCKQCLEEYRNPLDRRFHTQCACCSECGPQIQLVNSEGIQLIKSQSSIEIIEQTVELLLQGKIIAIKGVGGFQLWCLAKDQQAVDNLRKRKNRPDKPFAVMVSDLQMAKDLCVITEAEEQGLRSAEAPIVLLNKKKNSYVDSFICSTVASSNPYLGLMLPSSPIHFLLLQILQQPVIATSGNISGDPIAFENHEALRRLGKIADSFLINNRRIIRPLDDSVVRYIDNKMQVIRLARGLSPALFKSEYPLLSTIALGGDQKNALAVAKEKTFILGHHLGDLGSETSLENFRLAQQDFKNLLELKDNSYIHDLHPEYLSTSLAPQEAMSVQHHQAHLAACIAEHSLKGSTLGVIWDGTGYGKNNQIWGGEFLYLSETSKSENEKKKSVKVSRIGHLSAFQLLGGESAVRDPKRVIFAMLHDIQTDIDQEILAKIFSKVETQIWQTQLKRQEGVWCSSVGRLFDAIYSLILIYKKSYFKPSFEGQFAMNLEFLAQNSSENTRYNLTLLQNESMFELDWRPMMREIIIDLVNEEPIEKISRKFHSALVYAIKESVQTLSVQRTFQQVVLSGGCFQNKILLAETSTQLRNLGYSVYRPEQAPINDGGLALGQAYLAQYMVDDDR